MPTYDSLEKLPPLRAPAHLAVGMFDGVHLGHVEVIGGAVQAAHRAGGVAGVLTFSPHPSRLFRPENPVPQILSLSEKEERIGALGADFIVHEPFTRELAALDAGEFLKKLRHAIPHLAAIHVGKNFRFGKNRAGDIAWLVEHARALGLHVFGANDIEADGERISSTRIRNLITAGEIESANALLGYNYRVRGAVVAGRALGRTLGFPTLNVAWTPELMPRFGVYAVRASAGGERIAGVANYGIRPTVENSPATPLLETHLFAEAGAVTAGGFSNEKTIAVELLKFIRPEKKFADFGELRAQISEDASAAVVFFRL